MSCDSDIPLVTLEEIRSSRELVNASPHCVRTPLLQHVQTMFSVDPSIDLYLKLENMQTTGSFKIRGIITQLAHLPPGGGTEKSKLVTMSAGNYGKGFAYMLNQMGLKGVVLLPDNAPQNRTQIIQGFGAEVERYPGKQLLSVINQYVKNHNMTFLPAFDDHWLVAGQASLGLEILDDVPDVDVVVVCCGGGGALAGIASAIKLLGHQHCRIYGVEPKGSNTMYESFRAGRAVEKAVSSVATGLSPPFAGKITYRHCKEFVEDILLVSDKEIISAMLTLYHRGLVVEPSGAAAFAALQTGKVPDVTGKKVVVMVTGGNIGPDEWSQYTNDI